MTSSTCITVRVQREDFDVNSEIERLSADRTDIGAVASFSGRCRDESGRLSALELEHYPGMAESAIRKIGEEAARRFPLTGITLIHRYGLITPGENIVFAAAAALHRAPAFSAIAFLMDFLKTDAPFWKKEHLTDGSCGNWVSARKSDDCARDEWRRKA